MAGDPFAAIGSVPTNKATSTEKYPLLNDPKGGELVTDLYDAQQRKRSAESTEKACKSELGVMCKNFLMRYWRGKSGDPPSSIEVRSEESGRACKVSIKDSYPKVSMTDMARVGEIARAFGGEAVMMRFLRAKTELKISVDKIPEDRIQSIGSIIVKVFSANADELEMMSMILNQVDTTGGCSDAIERSTVLVPNEGFHTTRHRDLSLAENQAVDAVFPCTVSVGQVK